MPETYTTDQLRDLREQIADVARRHRERMAAFGLDPDQGDALIEPDEDEDETPNHDGDFDEDHNPREKGDDDGVEYGDPRDELEDRRSER
jgi:hypothetical protein